MTIHFFRDRTKKLIDYKALIDGYFAKIKHCNITSDDEQVKMNIKMPEFDFEYNFFITKKNRVSTIYRLNPAFININLFVEIDSLVPQFIIRKILSIAGEVCKNFELSVYYDHADNVRPFDMFELLGIINDEKNNFFKHHPEEKYLRLPVNVLNTLCSYESSKSSIVEDIKGEVIAPPYLMLYDDKKEQVLTSILWNSGTPVILPPELQYIVYCDETSKFMVSIESVIKQYHRFITDIKNSSLQFDTSYISQRNATKLGKKILMNKKIHLPFEGVEVVKLSKIIEA